MILYPVPPSAKGLCICDFFFIVQDDMQSLYNKKLELLPFPGIGDLPHPQETLGRDTFVKNIIHGRWFSVKSQSAEVVYCMSNVIKKTLFHQD